MRENYRKNCDAISKDATYKTNKYLIPLVTFIGISNEGKLTVFGKVLILFYLTWQGYGLILTESQQNYNQLFQDFLYFHEIKLSNWLLQMVLQL